MEVRITNVDNVAEYIESPSVDFIKVDVEGHELHVRKGAAETIKTFKPSWALSAYHRGDDLVQLPKVLSELNSSYTFYLRHCSPSWHDTVLYAI